MGWCRRNGTKAGEVEPELGRIELQENDDGDDQDQEENCKDNNVEKTWRK